MGVRGLKSFIENNDDLLIKDYKVRDTLIVFDACNLIGTLMRQSQKHERRDLFGGDMVQFGRYVNRFFDNFEKCNIKPILVFDGAQTRDVNKSKTQEKRKRALEKFHNVMSINKCGFGDFILPATSTNAFRSILVDRGMQIVQCMYEADIECARLSHELKCPVASNDSDFFLIDLPFGLLPIDLIKHQLVLEDKDENDTIQPGGSHHFINCSLYKQDNFTSYFPNLDKKSLPLLAVLAGNDFVRGKEFEYICSMLPLSKIAESCDLSIKQFRRATSKQHERIIKILYFLCNKSINQAINQLMSHVPSGKRSALKTLIKSNLTVYNVTKDDDFLSEFRNIYQRGYYSTFKKKIYNEQEMKIKFDEISFRLMKVLKHSMEKSVLSYRCLELAQRNIIFMQSQMDDPNLPSAHLCQIRTFRVFLTLLRSHRGDKRPCIIYMRHTDRYDKSFITPIDSLEQFGPLNYIFYDILELDDSTKKSLLLATFHCSSIIFSELVHEYNDWFDSEHIEAFIMINVLMNFIDKESKGVKMWRHFRQATLLSMLYYLVTDNLDTRLKIQLEELNYGEFLSEIVTVVSRYKLKKTPILSKKRLYNCRVMHQITQLQVSIVSFNMLNAFLSDILTRIRTEEWLNSCLIYNLAESLHKKQLKLPRMPYFLESFFY